MKLPESTDIPSWWIYQGTAAHGSREPERPLPEPPPWRRFVGQSEDSDYYEVPVAPTTDADATRDRRLGRNRQQAVTYQADDKEINLVNLALHLRRPLLVTGQPGVGKSTLAYSVAYELRLGPVLRWPISSRSTLQEGLYQYDAVGRLQEVSLQREGARRESSEPGTAAPVEIGNYLRLGPLGTALLPTRKPRALLIDEIDKSDIDLPNDLLNVFEEGEFTIPELARLTQQNVPVKTADLGRSVIVRDGRIQCVDFPFVVLTSNNEREFPHAFLRRCIRLEISPPDENKLARMVAAHLDPPASPEQAVEREELIASFIRKQRTEGSVLANDQLLNALMMAATGLWDSPDGRQLINDSLLRPLDQV